MESPSLARDKVLEHFQWIDGDADTWTMLHDGDSLHSIVDGLADLLRDDEIDLIVGIEARGFVLAPLVAYRLGIGFSPIRKADAMFPGPTISRQSGVDYRGQEHRLTIRSDHFFSDQRVALVDDWIETGSQARTARELIETTGASLVSVAVIIDEASPGVAAGLPRIRSLVRGDELG